MIITEKSIMINETKKKIKEKVDYDWSIMDRNGKKEMRKGVFKEFKVKVKQFRKAQHT